MKKLLIVVAIVLCFTACRKVALYHDLSEEEANEMLVVLQQEGIKVSKIKEVRQNEVYWIVQVDSNRLSDARRLLVEHNLPRKKELGLAGVYKEKGLIPTPDEQKARYLLALKGEIINSLLRIPEVIDADVVLNIPTPDEFAVPGAKEKRPTASVVIKARPSNTSQDVLTESRIQQFVANTVENLNPRDVSVVVTYLTVPRQGILPGQSLVLPSATETATTAAKESMTRVAGVEVSATSQGRLRVYLVVFFGFLAVLSAVLIVMIVRSSRMRQELNGYKGGEQKSIEGKVVEDKPRLEGRRR